ncbi:hypothetical protein AQF52_7791 [Streptomyces venezuelae]|nr:hypothetical protein AQF52_7791 [Streptomyces venezuelae]
MIEGSGSVMGHACRICHAPSRAHHNGTQSDARIAANFVSGRPARATMKDPENPMPGNDIRDH